VYSTTQACENVSKCVLASWTGGAAHFGTFDGYLMDIWKNKSSGMVNANEIGQWIERDRIKKTLISWLKIYYGAKNVD
jgi:hypothetical protein